LIGIGATVLNDAIIGKGCTIGAHALVPGGKNIPDGAVVMGSPGKVIKQSSEQAQEGLLYNAQHYVENASRFRTGLQLIK